MSKFSQVQKQQKQLPYTVSPIGDSEALKHWKAHRLQKDTAYRADAAIRFEKTKEVAVAMVSNQGINPFKFTPEEQEEIKARHQRLAALKRGIEASRASYLAENPPSAPTGLLARIKAFFT